MDNEEKTTENEVTQEQKMSLVEHFMKEIVII